MKRGFRRFGSFGRKTAAKSNGFSRVPHRHCTRLNLSHHDSTRSENRIRPHLDARPDKDIRTDPDTASDRNGRGQERQIRFGVIMAPRAQMDVLRNKAFRPNRDLSQRIKLRLWSHGRVVAHLEIPRIKDLHGGIDPHRLSQLCSKQAENEVSPSIEGTRSQTKK